MKIGHCAQWMEGTISLVLVDNLGSNGIGGFMESFSAQGLVDFVWVYWMNFSQR